MCAMCTKVNLLQFVLNEYLPSSQCSVEPDIITSNDLIMDGNNYNEITK